MDMAYVTEEAGRNIYIGERKKNVTNFLLEELAGVFHRYGKPGNGGQ